MARIAGVNIPTNKRVITKFGFISRRTVEINMAKVESVQVEQSLFGRLFNYGTLLIAGSSVHDAPLSTLRNSDTGSVPQ